MGFFDWFRSRKVDAPASKGLVEHGPASPDALTPQTIMKMFADEVLTWPREQAAAATLVSKAFMEGEIGSPRAKELLMQLTVRQASFVLDHCNRIAEEVNSRASPEPSTVYRGWLDVDDFDSLNDKLGRDVGDQVALAYLKLVLAKTGVGPDSVLNENGLHVILEAMAKGEDFGVVVCRPYISGDEFVLVHRSAQRVRAVLQDICRTAEALDVQLTDDRGERLGVLHGIPISSGFGSTEREAWGQVIAEKQGGKRRKMLDRLELGASKATAAGGVGAPPNAPRVLVEYSRDEGKRGPDWLRDNVDPVLGLTFQEQPDDPAWKYMVVS